MAGRQLNEQAIRDAWARWTERRPDWLDVQLHIELRMERDDFLVPLAGTPVRPVQTFADVKLMEAVWQLTGVLFASGDYRDRIARGEVETPGKTYAEACVWTVQPHEVLDLIDVIGAAMLKLPEDPMHVALSGLTGPQLVDQYVRRERGWPRETVPVFGR